MKNWDSVPDALKKYIFKFSGGFRCYHVPLFSSSLRSIEKRYTDFVCYICGLQNSFLRCGLTRHPSTRMYVKKNNLSVEIFGKCTNHDDGPLSVEGTLIPRNVETEEQIMDFVKDLFPETDNVFMFTTDEDNRSGWKVLEYKTMPGIRNSFG